MNGELETVDRPFANERTVFAAAVLAGLSDTPRSIPARFLYDARGSALFDEICALPEYYLTRAETEILRDRAREMARLAGAGCILVEYGSGSSVKSRLLIEALAGLRAYVPIDVSRDHLAASADRLRREYPALRVLPICADYMELNLLPPGVPAGRRLGFFPGSTIGNLPPDEAVTFLGRARRLLGPDGAMLLGIDVRKDPAILHDAYNDAAGVTARFSLNLLARMNRELGADFDLSQFVHEAFYDATHHRIEIYLRSLQAQTATVAGKRFAFAEGERIHTEFSYKYDEPSLAALAAAGGFVLAELWKDSRGLFAMAWLRPS